MLAATPVFEAPFEVGYLHLGPSERGAGAGPLHHGLVHTVDGHPGEVAAKHQRPERVTDIGVRAEAAKESHVKALCFGFSLNEGEEIKTETA